MEGEEKGKGRPGGKKEREVKEKRIGSEVEGKNEGIRNGEKYEKGGKGNEIIIDIYHFFIFSLET